MKPLGLPPLHKHWSDYLKYWLLAWSVQCSGNSIHLPPLPPQRTLNREYWKYKYLFSDVDMKQLSLIHSFLPNAPEPDAHQK